MAITGTKRMGDSVQHFASGAFQRFISVGLLGMSGSSTSLTATSGSGSLTVP